MPVSDTASRTDHFQWNFGGWFGSMIGSTFWMLLISFFLIAFGQPVLALLPLAGFCVINGVAIVLWRRRDRFQAYAGFMILLTMMAAAFPLTWVTIEAYAGDKALAAMNWPDSIGATLVVCLIVPCMMAWFTILHQRSQRPAS